MSEDDVIDVLDKGLASQSRRLGAGVESAKPPFEVLRFYARPVRLSALPFLGTAQSVVAVARMPADLRGYKARDRELVSRASHVARFRYPRRQGLTIGLSLVTVSDEPIGTEDDSRLADALSQPPRFGCLPLCAVLLNLSHRVMALALRRGPEGLFTEPEDVIDALAPHFSRYVPLMD